MWEATLWKGGAACDDHTHHTFLPNKVVTASSISASTRQNTFVFSSTAYELPSEYKGQSTKVNITTSTHLMTSMRGSHKRLKFT